MNTTLIHKDIDVEKDERKFMLTTIDNPFNPFTQYESWYAFDTSNRFIPELGSYYATNCTAYQARIAYTSPDMTDQENEAIIDAAIEEIIRLDPFGIYTKAYEP